MLRPIPRRRFFRDALSAAAGAALAPHLGRRWTVRHARAAPAAGPLIVASHSNETGRRALEEGWAILAAGGSALDAVERATNVVEVDPDDSSVGYGGLPNEDGVVQLDASIMDGRTYSAGAVAALENIKTPSSVARLVMERTDHVLLVGQGALAFARSFGFVEESLLTPRAREEWLRWREDLGQDDDWGLPEHLVPPEGGEEAAARPRERHYGTVNVLAVDGAGDVAGITSTSGLSFKLPGRVGDSPIIGAGLYVDNEVGAAGATGRGEDVIKSCASYYIVLRMREGRSPQEACEDALAMIAGRYRAAGLGYMPREKFVAVNRSGEVGCAHSDRAGLPKLSVRGSTGLLIYEGTRFER